MEKEFIYTEKQVRFLLGAYTGALIKSGLLESDAAIKSLPVFKQFWEDYRDIDSLPDQEMIKLLTK